MLEDRSVGRIVLDYQQPFSVQRVTAGRLGGDRRFVANAEVLFPLPGYKEKNVRLGFFFDLGNVWGPGEKIRAGDIRMSTGLAVSWDSPVGPLRFSLGQPLRSKPGDKVERFQFQLGKIF